MRRTEREVQNTGVCNEQETYDTSQGHLERHGKRGLECLNCRAMNPTANE